MTFRARPAGVVPGFDARRAGAVLVLNLALALAYYLAAQAGLAVSIGPRQITAVWPPSGLALAAFMVWGWPALPGIALGSFWLNWQAHLGGALMLTAGSLLQAALAARLLRGMPEALAERPTRQTLRFAVVVAACCVVAASVGAGTLAALGLLAPGEVAHAWLTWWLGDFAGMLVIAPPLLLWLHQAIRRDPISSLAFPILCMGLGLALVTSYLVGHLERETRIERFRSAARALATTLQSYVDIAQRDLEVLQASHYRVQLDEEEFQRFAAPMLRRSPWQHNFAWLPWVERGARKAFERELGGDVVQLMREVSSGERVIPALDRPAYLPVRWTAPAVGQEALLGVDEGADVQRAPTIARVRERGGIAATPPLQSIVRAATDRVVVTLYAPIGDAAPAGAAAASVPDRPVLRGLVSATIDLGRMLQAARAVIDDEVGTMLLHDPAVQGMAGMLWRDGNPGPWRSDDPAGARDPLGPGTQARHDVRVADRTWVLAMAPSARLDGLALSWLQVGVFGAGLAFTGLLTGFMVARRRRELALQEASATLESQVIQRTADLSRANDHLQQEVAERRQLEQALREASVRAEAANRAKSMFLANMSHEIRTPLNAVLGYTQLLLEDARLDAATRQRLDAILAAGQRLLRLINDVLDISKIEAGGLTLRPQPFDLARELREAVALVEPRARAKGLGLAIDLAGLADAPVTGDRAKVGQAVLNLLANAVKFSDHGEVALRAWRDGAHVHVTVADQGPGIAAEELAQLFSPFRQGQAGMDKGGTGLGLALSRGMAQAMGGDLTLASRPGQGTQAHLRLPLPVFEAAAGGAGEGPGAPASRRLDPATPCRVVVADDDAASCDVLAQALRGIGCEVRTAADGAAALAACRQAPVDIVFTDIRMPVMDGLQLRRCLREDPALARLPVVAVTASSLAHERSHFIEQGFDDFIAKPYALGAVYAALDRHCAVRFVAAAPPAPAQALAGAPSPSLRESLSALAEGAAAGDVAAVRRAVAALEARCHDPGLQGPLQRLAAAARTYDFGLLERLAREAALALPAERPA